MSNPKLLKWPGGQLDFSAGCIIMGILNVTPDSFSDGGSFIDVDRAVDRGIEMAKAGAAIIDIGPESTRPGAEPVSIAEQIRRAVPVIEKLADKTDAVISIDARSAEVAAAAIDAGAAMINDITALGDPAMAKLAAEKQLPVILMHMKGEPATMQQKPVYGDVVAEVLDYLLDRANTAQQCGISRDHIIIDPGIGFGKTFDHNIELMRNLDVFVKTGYRVLLGTSRKAFIGRITGKEVAADRKFGTAATVALAAATGVLIVRVHDIAEMTDVVKVVNQIVRRES